ncbi:hypothetical protein NOR_04358 [Metarhizium rileyi]|uniref:Myb-like DNA-binding domain-containing protein n=1 Tax=Metarhizium rileyi (strain RCEF 4871) TaxID=1649241 RepID=A0A162JLL2_METRR|nr:hypothetical protein NOR_04358 [Metarhizium rileyi RCEF 4871]TWU78644.1 hypothetical protein ED733_005462 [Metarhizium rileyi]
MPATQDPTEQVRFLVTCIGNTSNGRPDFAAVAEELGIVSKAAAQKRYERMLKANGVSAVRPPAKGGEEGAIPTPQTTPVKRKAAAPRTPAKKTKGNSGKDVKKEEFNDEEGGKGRFKKEEDSDSDLSDPPVDEDDEI